MAKRNNPKQLRYEQRQSAHSLTESSVKKMRLKRSRANCVRITSMVVEIEIDDDGSGRTVSKQFRKIRITIEGMSAYQKKTRSQDRGLYVRIQS